MNYSRHLILTAFFLASSTAILSADPAVVAMDDGVQTVAALPFRQWTYFQIDVPAQINGQDVLGWELRVKDWTGGNPELVVRRDQQPTTTGSTLYPPGSWATFASGKQLSSNDDQWTGRNPVRNSGDTEDRVLSLAMSNPLEPGTYYIGVFNRDYSEDCAFTFQSRAIGVGMGLNITDVAPGADTTVSGLAPREPAYFRINLPAPVPAWRFELDFGATTPDGEGMLVLRKDFVPNSQRNDRSYDAPYTIDIRASGTTTYQTELAIGGKERATILPAAGETMVPAGTYYAMVVSEGMSPAGTSDIGSGDVDFVLRNTTAPALEELGEIPFESPANRTGNIEPGENRFFRFTVPENSAALSISIDDVAGTPVAALRTIDNGLPRYSSSYYGLAGGQSAQKEIYRSGVIHLISPTPGEHALLVRTNSTGSCSFAIEIETQSAAPITFDDGVSTVSALSPERWSYFLVDVPAQIDGEDVLGWEMRVKDWTGGDPQIVVRRDLPPDRVGNYTGTGGYMSYPGRLSAFASGQQHYSENDQWTERSNSTGSLDGVDRVLSLAMGNPLEPGTYHVGIYNDDSIDDCAFTLQSRAIGNGMSLEVTDVTPGAETTISDLAPREPAYFRYTLPLPVPSWRFELDFGAATPDAEAMLVLRKDFLPNSQRNGSSTTPPYAIDTNGDGAITYQTELDIAGRERVTVLPAPGETMVPAGSYYAMVVGEGNSPSSTSRIGTGNVDLILRNETPHPVTDLGSLPAGSVLTDTSAVPQGGTTFYRYEVTDSSWPLEFRLKGLNATTSTAYLRTSDGQLPKPSFNNYGVVGGASSEMYFDSGRVVTLANPPVGIHALTIQSDSPTTSGAEFEITIVQKNPTPLGFSSLQTGGPSNSGSFDLADGEYAFFQVEIPELVDGQEFLGWKLEFDVATGGIISAVKPEVYPISLDTPFGIFGSGTLGSAASIEVALSLGSGQILSLGNPFSGGMTVSPFPVDLTPGPWIVQIEASGDASGTLTSEAIFASPLNLDASLNDAGGTHTVQFTGGEGRKFYRVEVPETVDGETPLGWKLQIDPANANIRVSPDQLPINYGATVYGSTNGQLLLDGSQVSPGTYYVEVYGENTTEYTLTSSAITSADISQTWTMPARGETPATPGVAAPLFADSGVDLSGSSLPGDQGIDLASGQTHYYTMQIPEGNEGLLQARLDALGGNPDLFIRREALFTGDDNYEYSLQQDNGTDDGLWVAADGKIEKQLTPGTYYLSVVSADGAASRYRLRLSIGNIQNLAIDGGSFSNQSIADGEWRYFRVEVPYDLPEQWQLDFFSAPDRTVRVYLRDTVPPGPASDGGAITSWADERKNQGSYSDYLASDTAILSAPQLRPGHTYYIGFNALADSTFTVSSQIAGGTRTDPAILDFSNGTVTDTLAPGAKRYFRVPVPAAATRWIHSATHSNKIHFYLEQGSFPSETSYDDFRRAGYTNSSLNRVLYTTSDQWPWVAGESCYFAIINTGTIDEPFTLNMEGESALPEDEDNDLIPDQWERDNVGFTDWTADYDGYDNDGIPLILEYFFGLNPLVPDQPEITPSRDGGDFLLDFRKTAQTPLLRHRITRNPGLAGGAATWTDTHAAFELLSDDGATQLWRARVPITPGADSDFFRIEVDEAP